MSRSCGITSSTSRAEKTVQQKIIMTVLCVGDAAQPSWLQIEQLETGYPEHCARGCAHGCMHDRLALASRSEELVDDDGISPGEVCKVVSKDVFARTHEISGSCWQITTDALQLAQLLPHRAVAAEACNLSDTSVV